MMITEARKQALEEVEELIAKAMRRVSVQKETDLCHFIPGSNGRLHHFAFGKLKKKNPEKLGLLVKEHIIETANPRKIEPTRRSRSNSKKGSGVKLNKVQADQLLTILKNSSSEIEGAGDLIAALTPPQSFKQVQKSMLTMIREKKADMNLWETYVRLVAEQKSEV